MVHMPDPCLPQHQLPPIPDGTGIMPIAENEIARDLFPELSNAPPEGFTPDGTPVLDDALEETYRRVLARALGIAACALFLGSITAATLIENSSHHPGFLGLVVYLRVVFVVQLLLMGFCNRYIGKLSIVPAAIFLFAYTAFSAIEFSILISPRSLAVAFLCTGLMYSVIALWGFRSHFDLARPVTSVFMILAGGVILTVVNLLLRSSSSVWTLSADAVVIFTFLAGYFAQQIRDFYQEYDDDNAEGLKASVLGALLLLINSVNVYLLVTGLMRLDNDDEDPTDKLSH